MKHVVTKRLGFGTEKATFADGETPIFYEAIIY